MIDVQRLVDDPNGDSWKVEAVADPKDAEKISHHIYEVKRFDPNTGEPVWDKRVIPPASEIEKMIAATQKDLDGLNALLALVQPK